MITSYETTRGALPAAPDATSVALEAGVSNERAAEVIGAAWVIAERWTRRTFYPVATATMIGNFADTGEGIQAVWPTFPYPDEITIQKRGRAGWQPDGLSEYIPELGAVVNLTPGLYRFSTSDVPNAAPGPHVVEAVRCLAMYLLIQSPARREFKTVTSGDSTLNREALDGILRASGAGFLLASEVRW